MTHELSYNSVDDYVILRIQGEVTIQLIREVAPEVAAMFKETGCSRLLNDMSEATINISMSGLFGSPKIMDTSGVSRSTRRALVVPPNFDDASFLENLSRNRGHNLKVFTDVEEAKTWLFAK